VRYLLPILLASILFISAGSSSLYAQERCATNYLQKLQNRPREADARFEQWLKSKLSISAQENKEANGTKRRNATFQIPVVVHIIHNGVEHATNIPDEQVISQIRVLNDDFNRTNADASQTPSVFLDEAGSLDVEFVLAKRTPDGLPTSGIVRVQGPKATWRVSDNYQLKSLSYWPAEDYLNIWVCNLESYLGYAQFPQSDILDGLESASTNRLTDGVVIGYDVFGSADDGDFSLDPKYNKGRTATHEVGHFFGLRHISGDDEGECGNAGDYVDDTPDQANQTYNCPSHPQSSCSETSMFQNYLDYTNDACMNLFTNGQTARMNTVLENSPRRKSLTESNGGSEPEPVANDLGIKSILSPMSGECGDEIAPSLEIKNYGSNTITSGEIRIQRDGVTLETKTFNFSLGMLESQTVAFSPVAVGGSAVFTFEIIQANGGADGNSFNNSQQQSVFVPSTIPTPVIENFDALPDQWIPSNPDGLFSWEIADAPVGTTPNKSLLLNFYDYEDSEGEIDLLVTPLIDLAQVPVALLLFDVAHARYQSSNDGLKIYLLQNCNTDINDGILVYDKSGSALATTTDQNTAFVPTTRSQWRTEGINLADYIGQKVQLAFVGVNDWGNNLYLDNIKLLTESFVDLTLVRVISPAPANCVDNLTPRLLVRNSGTAVSTFDISYSVNGVTTVHQVQQEIAAGAETEVVLPAIQLSEGLNEVSFTLEKPNGIDDIDPTDNHTFLQSVFSAAEETIPFRQNFEGNADNWISVSPTSGMKWQPASVNEGSAVFHEGFNNSVEGNEAWLVSPSVNLAGLEEASLYFDLSYALRNTVSDQLEVRVSTGCNAPFDLSLATYSGAELSDFSRAVPWQPDSPDDWKTKNIDLTDLLDEEEVRFAFVVTNNKGNNLYLDNIELFLSGITNRVEVDGFYNIYPNPLQVSGSSSIAFNFAENQHVTIQIVDNIGRILYATEWENILNQVYDLPVENYRNGIYHVRIIADGEISSSKLLIAR
jgi:hypothetical protein